MYLFFDCQKINGENMSDTQSKWQTNELAATFLQDVRGAIPAAGLQLEVIGRIIRFWRPAPICILDIGCGDGAIGRYLMNLFPKTRAVFADFSDPMLDAAKKLLNHSQRASIIKADFSSSIWLKNVSPHQPIDVAVSGFAIHHQPDQRKQELYKEVFDLLMPGGVFLNLEHVASPTPDVQRLFDGFFVDHLYRFHQSSKPRKTREEIAKDYYHRPDKDENILASVDIQCQWLKKIGFADVDCFFKIFELALFGGRKTSTGIK
jgi:tRNA (cmo5U34)-methyltransferase